MPAVSSRTLRLACAIGALALSSSCRDAVAPNSITKLRSLKSEEEDDSDGKLALSYVCGNKFLVQSSLEDSVVVRWQVDDSSDSGSVWLPPKPSGAKYSERNFTTHHADTTRLFLKKKFVRSAANGGSVCPGSLAIVAGNGVVGIQNGTTAYPNGTTVTYAAQPDVGYTSVHVYLDTVEVAASGTITIAGSRTLLAYATLDSAALPVDPGLVGRFRSLLTSRHQVADYQSLIYATSALAAQVGPDRADTVLSASSAAAYHLPADTAALRRLEQALDGHVFAAESLPPELPALHFGRGNTLPFGFPATVPEPVGGGANPITPRPVDVVFVNGWFTDVTTFKADMSSLEQATREVPQFADTALVHVSGVYNFSGNLPTFIISRGARCLPVLFPERFRLLPWFMQVPFLVFPCDSAAFQSLLANGGGELFETWAQVVQVLSGIPPHVNSVALDSLLRKDMSAQDNGNHMIVVPHSQGNFFMINSLSVLERFARAPSDTDGACIAMIPTASPTSQGYPVSYRVQPVQLVGDFINNVSAVSPLPQFSPLIDTPLWAFLRSRAGFFNLADQVYMHNFRLSYLSPIGGRPFVKHGLSSIYTNCEMSVSVSAPDTVLSVGVMSLSATVKDANGNAISPATPIVWTTSDGSVASVDQNGVLTVLARGRVRVTASYRHRHGDAFVAVGGPAPHLTVNAQNVASDVAPFWLASSSEKWRRRDVTVTVTSTDAQTSVNFVQISGTDSYGNLFGTSASQSRLPGGQYRAEALFYDNPRTLDGRQLRFLTANQLFVMDDAVYVQIVYIENGRMASQSLRIPLSP